jgi:lactoylglutathione lyase
MRVNYCIILVSSMARSVAFYRDVVGMPLRFESPDWTEFNTDGATWALHSCDSPAPTAAGLRAETAGQCRPGFQVPDLGAFHARMLEHQVPCVQQPAAVFGTRIAQYVDPDGLVFSVAEAMSADN